MDQVVVIAGDKYIPARIGPNPARMVKVSGLCCRTAITVTVDLSGAGRAPTGNRGDNAGSRANLPNPVVIGIGEHDVTQGIGSNAAQIARKHHLCSGAAVTDAVARRTIRASPARQG